MKLTEPGNREPSRCRPRVKEREAMDHLGNGGEGKVKGTFALYVPGNYPEGSENKGRSQIIEARANIWFPQKKTV